MPDDRIAEILAQQNVMLAKMDEHLKGQDAILDRMDARTAWMDERAALQTDVLAKISENQVRLADVLTEIVNRLRQPPTSNGH